MRPSPFPPAAPPQGNDQLPEGRPKVISVMGAWGASAGMAAGVDEVLERLVDPVKTVAASGGAIVAAARVAGLNAAERRAMNAGAPYELFFDRPAHDRSKKRISLTGVFAGRALPTWLDPWMEWAGTPTWGDLRYPPGTDPALGAYKLTVALCVWTTKTSFPPMSQAQLDDPATAQRLLRECLSKGDLPIGNLREAFWPEVGPGFGNGGALWGGIARPEFPWLAGETNSMRVAEVIGWTCRRYPAFIPKLLQDPETGQLKVIIDGASLRNQPNPYNGQLEPPLPMINVRMKLSSKIPAHQRNIDTQAMPWALVTRLESTGYGPLDFARMGPAARQAVYDMGVERGSRRLPGEIARYLDNYRHLQERAAAGGGLMPRPELHGARLIFADRDALPPSRGVGLGW